MKFFWVWSKLNGLNGFIIGYTLGFMYDYDKSYFYAHFGIFSYRYLVYCLCFVRLSYQYNARAKPELKFSI